jgi:NAD-dependent histone deacetylase SIR2
LNDVDRPVVDLVIVIGTSLKVQPVSMIPDFINPDVPQIYISREPIRDIAFDLQLLGDCDTVVAELCRAAGNGWELEHEMLHPETTKASIRRVGIVPGASSIKLPSADADDDDTAGGTVEDE